MKRSLATYINKSGGFIDNSNAPLAIPVLSLPVEIEPLSSITEPIKAPESLPVSITEEKSSESSQAADQVLTEESVDKNEKLTETLMEMKNFLVEQQQNQNQMSRVIAEMLDTIRSQNILTSQKFDQLDESAASTARMLKETSNKLESLVVRELSIPAPVVNVSLSEQKRIIKTVDRDSNGLIKQVTEEIQQSISENK